jgi:hypothetical protein
MSASRSTGRNSNCNRFAHIRRGAPSGCVFVDSGGDILGGQERERVVHAEPTPASRARIDFSSLALRIRVAVRAILVLAVLEHEATTRQNEPSRMACCLLRTHAMLAHEKLDVYRCAIDFFAAGLQGARGPPPEDTPTSPTSYGAPRCPSHSISQKSAGCRGGAERRRYLSIARGSATECGAILGRLPGAVAHQRTSDRARQGTAGSHREHVDQDDRFRRARRARQTTGASVAVLALVVDSVVVVVVDYDVDHDHEVSGISSHALSRSRSRAVRC